VALAADRVVGRRHERAHDLRRRLGAEPLRREHARPAERVHEPVGLLAAAARDGHQQRQLLEPRRQVGEEAQRGAVGPLGVVQQQRQRAALGEREREPVEPVDRRVDRLERRFGAHGVAGVGAEHRRRQAGLARGDDQRLLAHDALEELAHDAEAEVALELVPTRGERRQPAGAGRAPHLVQQCRLPDPRLALDQEHPARPGGSRRHGDVDLRQLHLALEQHVHACGDYP
jgi:hypothetical protein